MFAPAIAKAHIRPANKLASHSSTHIAQRFGCSVVEHAHILQRSISNQVPLQLLAEPSRSLTGNGRDDLYEVNQTVRRTPGASWAFSRISIRPPDRANRPHGSSPQTAPPLPGVVIHPKLVVGQVDDPLEHEADRVADQVMRSSQSEISIAATPPQVSRMCATCEQEEKTVLTKTNGTLAPDGEAPNIVREVLRAPSSPLDSPTRAFFEPRFTRSFADVRIHDDTLAARSAKQLGALAYTVGQRIVVDSARYVPGSVEGRRLLAHELAHTIQQSAGDGTPRSLVRGAQHLTQPSSKSAALSQKIHGDRSERHDWSVDDAVAQRQGDDSKAQERSPAGAPPVFDDHFDPVLDESSVAPSQSANDSAVQTLIQRSIESSATIQRQPAPPPTASGTMPVVATSLSWSDYPPVPNKIGGFSAQTGILRSWKNDGTGFSVAFHPATSWSVVADQTDDLLRHEQYHLNLAVLIANKANALAGTMKASALISAFITALTVHDRSYDEDTLHGENTRLQSLWEQDIDAGVPEFPITSAPGR